MYPVASYGLGFTRVGVRARSFASRFHSHDVSKGSLYAMAQSIAMKEMEVVMGAGLGWFCGLCLACLRKY